jgi:hypothetical protein
MGAGFGSWHDGPAGPAPDCDSILNAKNPDLPFGRLK